MASSSSVSESTIMTTGKFVHESFGNIYEKHPGYCQLIQCTPDVAAHTPIMVDFVNWLNTLPKKELPKDIIPVGKYEGLTFQQVYEQDPAYCEWVAGQENSPLLQDFANWLRSVKGFVPCDSVDVESLGDTVILTGKYTGWTFKNVRDKDTKYCDWVRNNIQRGQFLLFQRWLKTFH